MQETVRQDIRSEREEPQLLNHCHLDMPISYLQDEVRIFCHGYSLRLSQNMQARSLSSFANIKIHKGGTERRCLLHHAKQVGNQRLLLALGSKVCRVRGAMSSVCEARFGVQGL